jgi:hypothetical protein
MILDRLEKNKIETPFKSFGVWQARRATKVIWREFL